MSPVYIGWWEFRRMGTPFEAQGFVRSMSPKGGCSAAPAGRRVVRIPSPGHCLAEDAAIGGPPAVAPEGYPQETP